MWHRLQITLALCTAAILTNAQSDTLNTAHPPSLSTLMLSKPKPSSTRMHNEHTYVLHRAFFCNMEDKLDRKSKTKFRFRLGDQSTVDRLEGK